MGAPSIHEFSAELAARAAARQPFAVATVVRIEGSASARPGAKSILDERGRTVFGWVGGGCAESSVRDTALEALADGAPRLIRLDLDDEVLGVGMPCGGYMEVYVEPVIPAPTLLVLGHGRIAETVAELAHLLEFEVVVNDALASEAAFPHARERITEDPDYAKAICDENTYVVIATQHRSDYEALERILRQRPAYVGLVASRKRSALLFERLVEDGFPREALERVAAPAGLDLGAQTPQEIAFSIAAEISALRRGASGGQRLVDVKGVTFTEGGVEVPEGPIGDPEHCPS